MLFVYRKDSMKKLRMIIFALLVSNATFATTFQWHPLAAISGGVTNTINLGKSTSFPIINPNQDEFYQYSPNHKVQTKASGEIFLGGEHLFYNPWLMQAGVAYTQSAMFHPQGSLVQGADVQSQDQYQYQFDLLTRQVMLQTKWMHLTHERFYPYVLLGLGAAINTASHYTTTVPPTLTFTRVYSNKTSTGFAYRIGVGIDIDVAKHLRVGLAYRIADLGNSKLGSATIDGNKVQGSLSQSAIYSNEFLAQLTII
jgi:opacity protein-like surface antigen